MYFSSCHRSNRSAKGETGEMFIESPTAALPPGTAAPNPAVKMYVLPKKATGRGGGGGGGTAASSPARKQQKLGRQPRDGGDDSDNPETATTPIQTWHPAPPSESSTPPFESAAESAAAVAAVPLQRSRHGLRGGEASPAPDTANLRRVLNFFGKRKQLKIAPRPSTGGNYDNDDDDCPPSTPPLVPAPSSSSAAAIADAPAVSPSSEPPHGDVEEGLPPPPSPPFSSARDRLPSTPSVYDGDGGGSDGSRDEEGPASSSTQLMATKRAAPEADEEEGGLPAESVPNAAVCEDSRTAAAGAAAVVAATAVAVKAPARASRVGEPAVIENGIVMPCPPSDEEKVYYRSSGRGFLVAMGTLVCIVTTGGMWLFTIASPLFFWFGAPTLFLMFYIVFHYCFVAVWGKDFKPEDHEAVIRAAGEAGYAPTVDVFLPVCREDIALLRNTWRNVAAMEYPRGFEVHVLDDGAQDDVRDLADDFGFHYIRRDDRPKMKKAGNLRHAFARTSGEAIVIFDADFCPRVDFLLETTPYLLDPAVGIVQTPQYFRYRKEQTWVEQGAGTSQEYFYRMVQVNQDRFHGAVCVGSCGVYRRKAVEPFGGVVAISHSEDMYTGYKMTEQGSKIKYLPLCLSMGTCPDEPRSFFMQQYRWAMGSATLVSEKGFWSANLSTLHKVCFFNGLLYYIASAMILFLAPIPIIMLLYLKADSVLWYYSGFAVPPILMVGVCMPLWAKQSYGMPVHRVRVIQFYAHLYALKDHLMGTAAVWVPSGGGAKRSSSKAYSSSVVLMVTWVTLSTVAIVGGSVWRILEGYPWHHFVPAMALAVSNWCLSISTLFH